MLNEALNQAGQPGQAGPVGQTAQGPQQSNGGGDLTQQELLMARTFKAVLDKVINAARENANNGG